MISRPAGLLIPFAAVCIVAAACASDLAGPDGDARGVRPRRDVSPTTTCSDSVQAGYGTCCTGGIEYQQFEYDPATPTEYVCTDDPYPSCYQMTSTCDTTYTPPPPPPAPTSPTPTPTSPTGTR